jgi:predicted transcriptional regulator
MHETREQVLRRIAAAGETGEESPYGLGRRSGGVASAWHRTVTVLARNGLVTRERYGDHYKATVTEAGRRALDLVTL